MKRLFCGIAVVLAALPACGDDDGLSPQSLAGVWSGTTSQSRPFSFQITSQGLTQATINFQHAGPGCSYTATSTISGGTPTAIVNGSFTANGIPVGSNATMNASGTFTSGTAANGTATISDSFCGGTTNLTWTATRN